MGNTTYAETLASAQLIAAGLRSHLDKLALDSPSWKQFGIN